MAKKREAPPDLRQEIAKLARDPAIVSDIAQAVVREAGTSGNGGKGGASILKAYELVQGVLDQTGQNGGEPDYSRMTDDQIRAFIRSLKE